MGWCQLLLLCRFHSLGEFDEVKRSCRKRLDGHNRRRRKPQPPSLFMAAEKFMYNYKGRFASSWFFFCLLLLNWISIV